MKPALLLIFAIAACGGAGPMGPGDDSGDDSIDGGASDDGTWAGTAASSYDNGFSGSVISAEVSWRASERDDVGTTYVPEGTVTVAMTQAGCTVTLDPPSHAIDPDNDGVLYVDRGAGGTYYAHAGTFWDVMITTECPPNAPKTLPSTVAVQWLNVTPPVPMTDPDLIAGTSTQAPYTLEWSFTRIAP